MMNEQVYKAIEETFEGLAFLELTPDNETARPCTSDGAPGWRWASVEILAPIASIVTLVLPESLVLEIGSSLYGGDNVSEKQVKDVIGEMANTLAGKLMSSLYPGDVFTLGMPQTGKGEQVNRKLPYYGFLTDDDRRLAVLTDLRR